MSEFMYCRECNTERTGEICWKCSSKLEEVKRENWYPLNMPPLEKIRELAMECGYACAVHGSQERDLDVVLVAWDEKALTRNYQEVMHYIAEGLIAENGLPARVVEIEVKPLGRHACTIQMNGWYKQIDLSMAPFIAPPLNEQQALDILNVKDGVDESSWDFNSHERKPHWYKDGEYYMTLDGGFTDDDLLALLFFHPERRVGAKVGWPAQSPARVAVPKLTNEQALEVLNGADYVGSQDGSADPHWYKFGTDTLAITLDGNFTREELLAILHFHPEHK